MKNLKQGKQARLARIARDLTQLQLARAVGLHPSRLSLIENDLIEPKPAEARRLNAVLGDEVFPVEVSK